MDNREIKLNVSRNFGDKTYQDVFSFYDNGNIKNLSSEIEEDIKCCDILYVCAADYMSDDIMTYATCNPDIRIYVITKSIDKKIWNNNSVLKDNVIVRSIADLNGNYIFTQKDNTLESLYFVDKNCNGVAFKDEKIIEKIKKVFIKEFWNYANSEYICGNIEELKEDNNTFDISPVLSDKTLVLNQGVEEQSLLEKEINKAESIFITSKTNLDSISNLKTVCIKKIDKADESKLLCKYLNQKEIRSFYAPESLINYVKTADSLYICNFNIADTNLSKVNRNSRLFMLKVKTFGSDEVFNFTDYCYDKLYSYEDEITYQDGVGRDLLDFNKNKVEILLNGEKELKTTPKVDIHTMKQNLDKESAWESFLNENNICTSSQLAVNVDFEITIPAKTLTFDKKAKIYSEYDKAASSFESQFTNILKKIDKKIGDKNSDLTKKNNDKSAKEKLIENLKSEITKIEEDAEKLTVSLTEIDEKIALEASGENSSSEDNAKKKKSIKDIFKKTPEAQKKKIVSDIEGKKRDKEKREAKISDNTKILEKINNDIASLEENISSIESVKIDVENKKGEYKPFFTTIGEFNENKSVLDSAYELCAEILQGEKASFIEEPKFDKPKNGILYQKDNKFEYSVSEDELIEKAYQESKTWPIENVTIV